VARLVVELHREPALGFDAVDLLEEIEEPVAAMEFAVGAGFEADRFLQRDDILDRRALDFVQRRGIDLAALAFLARDEDRLGPQHAADDVSFERRHRFPHFLKKLPAWTFTTACAGSKQTPSGSPPSFTISICRRSRRRSCTTPRSLVARFSSECKLI